MRYHSAIAHADQALIFTVSMWRKMVLCANTMMITRFKTDKDTILHGTCSSLGCDLNPGLKNRLLGAHRLTVPSHSLEMEVGACGWYRLYQPVRWCSQDACSFPFFAFCPVKAASHMLQQPNLLQLDLPAGQDMMAWCCSGSQNHLHRCWAVKEGGDTNLFLSPESKCLRWWQTVT